MAKEIFKNLPDKSTPLSATKLNGLFDGAESMGSIVVEDVTCKNLFNKNNIIKGYRIASDGLNYADDVSFVSSYIEITPNTNYVVSNKVYGAMSRVAFYDSNKTFISANAENNGLLLSPTNAKYIRITNYLTSLNTIQLEKGSIGTNYVEHKEFSNKQHYSTEEQVIGTWIDGKTLYRKVVNCGALPNATSKRVAHGITDFEKIISLKGVASTSYNYVITLPNISTADVKNGVSLNADTTHIYIDTMIDRTTYTSSYAILEYTKTTD